jgi:hypothetical protein
VSANLRGRSAIKLAAGTNPITTASIFAMRIAPALGRRLTAIGSVKLACFFIAHTQIGLFHFSWERIVLQDRKMCDAV